MISEILIKAFFDLLTGIITNAVWFILIIWGVKVLSLEIRKGFKAISKEMPDWIQSYMKLRRQQDMVRWVKEGKII